MEIDIDRLHRVKLGELNYRGCGHTFAKCVDLAHLIMTKHPDNPACQDGQIYVMFPTENFRHHVLLLLEQILDHFDIPYRYNRSGPFLAGFAKVNIIYPGVGNAGCPLPNIEFNFEESPPEISEAPYFRVGALGEVYQEVIVG